MIDKALIIGAGPAGLTAALQLAKAGKQVEIFEASEHLGGLARTFELWGQRVDCGPHRFFSQDKRVNHFFREVIGDDYVMVDRLTRIYYGGKFYHYPLKPFNALMNLGGFTAAQVLLSYFRQKLTPSAKLNSFEDWVIDRFGKRLFDIFFKNYSEKLWGIPCSSIDADWAAQRIKKLSMTEIIKTLFIGDKSRKHNTLVDRFAYPIRGTGQLYDKIASELDRAGVRIHFNSPVKNVQLNGRGNVEGLVLHNDHIINGDAVVSTMPLTLMVKSLNAVPQPVKDACDKLKFRNTILVYLEVESKELFKDNWVYVHDARLRHGRITNFRNWSPELYGNSDNTILCMEYWCYEQDDIWTSNDMELGALACKELRSTGLLPEEVKICNTSVLRVPRCYPVYEIGYKEHLNVIVDHLKTINGLIPIGRYGAFKYNNQDHSILMGLLAADKLLGRANYDLWNINTDLQYQEAGSSVETGLDR